MKILTLNTWKQKGPWKDRWEFIFGFIRDSQPDVIAFQEIFSRKWAEKVKETLGYPTLVYTKESEASGLALLSKFPLLASSNFILAAQSSNFEPCRCLLFGSFPRPGGGEISVFNTHLTWRVDEAETRSRQIDEILKFAEGQKHPSVLCGDFNAGADAQEVRKVAQAGFLDTFEVLNPGSKALTWDNRNPYAAGASVYLPDRRIDFIFTRGLGKPKSSKIVLEKPNENGIYASDHYGVLAEYADC